MSKPKCIQCGRIKAVDMVPNSTEAYCNHCNIQFDTEDDGTTGYGDPARMAARNIDYQERNKRQRSRPRQQPKLKGGLE